VSSSLFVSWRIPCDMSSFSPKNFERTPRTMGETTYFAIRLDGGRPVWDTSPVEGFRDYKMLATSAPPRVHSHVSSTLRPRLAPIDFGCRLLPMLTFPDARMTFLAFPVSIVALPHISSSPLDESSALQVCPNPTVMWHSLS
jgi:hypothetical protein